MDPLIGAGLVKGGFDILGSLFSHSETGRQIKYQQEENQRNRDFNAQQAELNRQFQKSMFDAENEYNLPSNVVQRLQDAGLNPALAYGGFSGSASAPSGSAASSSGSISPTRTDFSGISSAGNAYLDSQMQKAQIKLLESQANNLDAQTPWVDKLNGLFAEGTKYDNALKRLLPESELKKQNLTDQQANEIVQNVQNLKKNLEFVDSQISINKLESLNLETILKYADRKQALELENMLTDIHHKNAQIDLTNKQVWQLARITPALVNTEWAKGESLFWQNRESSRNDEVLQDFYNNHKDELSDMKFDEFKATIDAIKRQGSGAAIDWFDSLAKALGLGVGAFLSIKGSKGRPL